MATPSQVKRLVEGILISGNAVGVRRYARNILDLIVLEDENGVERQWLPLNFNMDLPTQRSSLQLEMTLTIDGVGPEVITAFDRLPPESLAQLITVKLYSWLIPGDGTLPLILPPPRFIVEEVELSTYTVSLRCSGPLLPNQRAGRIYTTEDWPGLSTGS